MNIYLYIRALLEIERRLSENFFRIAEYHKTEPGIYYGCQEMASISADHSKAIEKELEIHKFEIENSGDDTFFPMVREHETGIDLFADLHFIWLLTMEAALFNNLILQAAAATSENDIELMCSNFEDETSKQSEWLIYRINMAVRRAFVEA